MRYWTVPGRFSSRPAGGADVVQAPPFVELTLELESLWV
jgi:hypothetical protein